MKKNILINIQSKMILLVILFEKFENNENNYNVDSNIITFCPGSRQSEIKTFMPIFLEIINSLGVGTFITLLLQIALRQC